MATPLRNYFKRVILYVCCRDEARSFRARFPPGFTMVLLASVLNAGCHLGGFYDKFELADSDLLDRFETAKRSRTEVSVVLIKEDTYQGLFDKKSPLSPGPLLEIVKAVCSFRPRVVGIDLFTGEWKGYEKADGLKQVAELAKTCPIVWIRDAMDREETDPGKSYLLGSVLGDDGPSQGSCAAVPVTQPDPDGIVRRYRTTIPALRPGGTAVPYYTLIGTLTAIGNNQGRLDQKTLLRHCGFSKEEVEEKPRRIRFSANRAIDRINAGVVTNIDPESAVGKQLRLNEKIVIVGGGYRYARDQYPTPIGFLYGAEIQANGVAAEPIEEASLAKTLLVELVAEVIILALMIWSNLRFPWAILLTLWINAVCALAISWSLYNYSGYFLGIFGALAGAVLGIVADVVFDPLKEDFRHWKRGIPNLTT